MNRLNTQGRRVGRLYGILLMMSYLGCIVVDAEFAPDTKTALKAAVKACLATKPDGTDASCDGNGPIGDWDVSKVTDFSRCTFATATSSKYTMQQLFSSFLLFDCFYLF